MLLLIGTVGIASGLLIDKSFPINKYLWSSSYAVFTAGIAACSFGVLYWLVDIMGYRRWGAPFVIYGMNAIAAYVLSSLIDILMYFFVITLPDGSEVTLKTYIFNKSFIHLASPVNASLVYAFTIMFFWFLVMALLYRRRIFIKI